MTVTVDDLRQLPKSKQRDALLSRLLADQLSDAQLTRMKARQILAHIPPDPPSVIARRRYELSEALSTRAQARRTC